jgi:hypothetical protein
MNDASERLALVTDLVTLSRPLEDILRDLARQPGDPDAELVSLGRENVVSVLERYLAGDIDAATVADWADAIELRDDVGVPEDDQMLRDLLFELANPPTAAPLTFDRAERLIALLRDV